MLRAGLIGCGYVSQFHLRGWQQQTLGKLVAVCDLDAAKANAAAKTVGATPYTDPEQMFADQSLDVVEICTLPRSHEILILMAARHRVHVLCQKPIAPDLDTIDRMLTSAENVGIRVMVHENWRFRPWYDAMKQLIVDKVIGEPVRLRINAHDFRCLAPNGLADQPYFAQMKQFVLFEMGPHLIDVARSLLGEPNQVFCVNTKAGPQAGEDGVHLLLRFPGSKVALLDMCWATATGDRDRLNWGLCDSVLEGTKGTVRTELDGQLKLTFPDGRDEKVPVMLTNDPRQQSYTSTQSHFLHSLSNGLPFATSLADNRKTMEVVFAGYKSAESTIAVQLPSLLATH